MKTMIIRPEQLRAINEAAMSNVMGAFDGTRNSLNAQITQSTTEMQKNGGIGTFMNPKNPSGPSVALNPATTDQEIASAGQVIANTGNTGSSTQNITMEESRFSKRQVELGRMLEMRRTGKVFSKKQLNEMFMETQENADRLREGIGNCRLKDIFDAIEEIFPEEIDGVKEAFMNGADLPEYICSIFSNDDINGEKEEAFLERLGI